MDWGTKRSVASEAEAKSYVASVQIELPPAKSAYVPSGKLPPIAILWLAFGAAAGVPAGALTGVLIGGISMALVALIGFVLGLMATMCGRVLCIIALLELAVALIGAGLTFAGIGAVPAWLAAAAGKYGKNRNKWAAMVVSLPAAVVAFAIVVAVPQVAAYLVGPADPADDFALSTLVHMLADPSWLTLALYGLGFLVTLGTAAFAAGEAVSAQKFCEPCERYMDEAHLHPMRFDVAKWTIEALRGGAGPDVASHVASESGPDVDPHVFGCPNCARGYFEATAHVHADWVDGRGTSQSRTEEWLCASIETAPEVTRALMAVKKPEPT